MGLHSTQAPAHFLGVLFFNFYKLCAGNYSLLKQRPEGRATLLLRDIELEWIDRSSWAPGWSVLYMQTWSACFAAILIVLIFYKPYTVQLSLLILQRKTWGLSNASSIYSFKPYNLEKSMSSVVIGFAHAILLKSLVVRYGYMYLAT